MTPSFCYRQSDQLGPVCGTGVMTLHQAELLTVLKSYLFCDGKRPPHPHDQEIVQWVEMVDREAKEPCMLPVGWEGIEQVLLKLIHARKFSVHCHSCFREYSASEVLYADDSDTWLWTGSRHDGIECPAGHMLFRTQVLQWIV